MALELADSTAVHDPVSTGAVWFGTGRVRTSCAEPGTAVEWESMKSI